MNTKNLVLASILAAVSGVALADGGSNANDPFVATQTRAQVQAQTLQARASGQLTPAGEGPAVVISARSTLRRGDLRAEVLQARASGQLVAAGEGPGFAIPFTSTLTRAEVKYATLQAREAGQLIPAGEGPDVNVVARANVPSHPVQSVAAWFRAHAGTGGN